MRCRSWVGGFLLSLVFIGLVMSPGATAVESEPQPSFDIDTYRATVLEVSEEGVQESYFGEDAVIQRVRVRIDAGPWEGERELENHLTGNPAYDLRVAPGDRVMVGGSEFAGRSELFIVDFVRDVPLLYLLGIFAVSLVVIGGLRGIKTLLVLGLTAIAVLYLLIPALLAGWNPIITTVAISGIVVSVSLLIITGFTTKTLAAVIGTVTGVLFAGLLAGFFGGWAHLLGLHTQEAQLLMFTAEQSFDFRGLLFAGMILGALGAVMDVSVSISSAVEEVHRAGGDGSVTSLSRAGLSVGRDVLGTMSNTLILAYTGSALPLLLLLTAHRADLVGVANMDIIATEIVRALSGSVGLVLCVPVTAFAAAYLKGNRTARSGSRTARSRRPNRSR